MLVLAVDDATFHDHAHLSQIRDILESKAFRRGLSLVVPLVLGLLAAALQLARRPSEGAADPLRYHTNGRWRRVLVPGARAAESGEGIRSFLALLLPAGLAMLPLFGELGYRLPWGYDAGGSVAGIVAIFGLSLYLGARLRTELRNEV